MQPELPPTNAEARREAAVDFLMRRINYERSAVLPYGERYLKLDRMRTVLRRLGNPEAGLPIVHIAGTKGKGSVSALVSSILHAAGFDVGVYSSPHLEMIEERFCINGAPCSGEELADLVDSIRPVVEQMDFEASTAGDPALSPTFFELATALALVRFARSQVDLVVLEVGLGGRLDSTNVCTPAVTAITSISLDHTKQLGDTVEKIAFEKGGIIKPGAPVVLGPLEPGPQQILINLAVERGSPVVAARRDFDFVYRAPRDLSATGAVGQIDFRMLASDDRVEILAAPLAMLGRHQGVNAATAMAIAVELRRQGWLISTDAMRRGLAEARLPGRVEVVSAQPTVVLDVAHNVASVAALTACLEESFPPTPRVLVFSASRDKDVAGMLRVLLPHFDRVILTEFQENPRAVPVKQLTKVCRAEMKRRGLATEPASKESESLAARPTPAEAWNLARQWAGSNALICITGSFFLVAELRAAATKEPLRG